MSGRVLVTGGLGFIGSAFVTIFLSRRLGLWQGQPPAESEERGA